MAPVVGGAYIQSVAPWLPAKKALQVPHAVKWVIHLLAAFVVLFYVIILSAFALVLEIPRWVLKNLISLGTRRFGMIVEHAYALRICRLHVVLASWFQKSCLRRSYHSRYADIRTELLLPNGATCFVHAVPCLQDNYCYVLVDTTPIELSDSDSAPMGLPTCVVDPCDAFAVEDALEHLAQKYYKEAGGLLLEAVLCTHRHWDHAGGNEQLSRNAEMAARQEAFRQSRDDSRQSTNSVCSSTPVLSFPQLVRYTCPLKVYAGAAEGAPGCTLPVLHGDTLEVGDMTLDVVAAPGHTAGSMMFRLPKVSMTRRRPDGSKEQEVQLDALFTGDTLFSGGCGAQFEGNSLDIEHCFATILASCDPSQTLLFPGHEYTSRILEMGLQDAIVSWAATETPGNFLCLCSAFYVAAHKRALRDKLPTVPVSLESERLVNPHFDRGLQRHVEVVLELLEASDSVSAREPDAVSTQPAAKSGNDSEGGDAATKENGSNSNAEPAAPLHAEQIALHDGEMVNALHTPALQFAFLYRTDLEALQVDLAEGRISGKEAAERLAQCEKNVFDACILTSEHDVFGNHGLSPEEMEHGPAEPAEPAEDQTGDQTDDAAAPEVEKHNSSLPKKEDAIEALKVLGVASGVPVGPKAPCSDLELPVHIKRLKAVLERLGVPEASVEALHSLVASENATPRSTDLFSSVSMSCGGLCGNSASPSNRQLGTACALESEDMMPLRQVLQLLRPTMPLEEESVWRITQRWFRRICRTLRRCRKRLSRCGGSNGATGELVNDDESPDDKKRRESSIDGEEDASKRREALELRMAHERVFTTHRVGDCPVCRGGFRERRTKRGTRNC